MTAPPVLRRGCYFNPLPPCGGRRTQSAECQTLGIFQSTPSVWRETPHNNAIYMRSWAGFQSTPSVWRETLPTIALCPILSISIHSLRVEGDQTHGSYYQRPCAISIHSLRVEGDLIADQKIATSRDFNPLPPCGGRLVPKDVIEDVYKFQSTPSVWRETRNAKAAIAKAEISIHSLRVEGDGCDDDEEDADNDFNPLPPCGGRRRRLQGLLSLQYFNPLPPCGGRRHKVMIFDGNQDKISIHSLRVEGDGILRNPNSVSVQFQSTPSVWRETAGTGKENRFTTFQSTPSVWRETYYASHPEQFDLISIHSLRVEGDPQQHLPEKHFWYFNPLPPCGGRLRTAPTTTNFWNFNPLPPCGGRRSTLVPPSTAIYFNPLPPCGGRPASRSGMRTGTSFQSTPSVWRETISKILTCDLFRISIHSLRVEGDHYFSKKFTGFCKFQSTPSVWRETLPGQVSPEKPTISIHSLRVEGDFPTCNHLLI